MIQPEDIREKAERIYRKYLSACLDNDQGYFPRSVPADRKLTGLSSAQAAKQVERLRAESKEIVGYGYTITWEERRSREFGRNKFPAKISFDCESDLLRFLRKQSEFDAFRRAVDKVVRTFPTLRDWIRSHAVPFLTSAPQIDGLLCVVRYFVDKPRPQLFARELPLPIDSKFIERNQGILRDWLDLILPPDSIRADMRDFERRFGLRFAEPHLLLRLLDRELQSELTIHWEELSLPPTSLGKLAVPDDTMVFLVENKTNLLTIPRLKRSLALGGLGNNVSILREIPWLKRCRIMYWGDVDVEGLEILSSLREMFPGARSFLMDLGTLERWRSCAVPGNGSVPAAPRFLTDDERATFQRCRDDNIRLEQERIDQHAVSQALAEAYFGESTARNSNSDRTV